MDESRNSKKLHFSGKRQTKEVSKDKLTNEMISKLIELISYYHTRVEILAKGEVMQKRKQKHILMGDAGKKALEAINILKEIGK